MNRLRTVIVIGVCWLAASQQTHAQTPNDPAVPSPSVVEVVVDAESITTLQKQSESTADLSDEVKARSAELAKQALDDLQAAAVAKQSAGELDQRTKAIPQTQRDVESKLSEPEAVGEPQLNGRATLSELDITRNELQQKVAELEQQLTQPAVDPAARTNRRKENRQFLIELPAQLEAVRNQLQAPTPEGEPPVLTALRQASLNARKQLLQRKGDSVQAELTLFDTEDAVRLPSMRRELLTRQLSRTRKLVELHVAEINRLRQEEADARARDARTAAMQAEPLLEPLLKKNEQIATEETEIRRLHEAAQQSQREIESQLTEVRSDYREIVELDKQQLGLSVAMGLRLRKLRGELPHVREHEQQRQTRLEVLEDSQFKLYERSDALNDVFDIEASADAIVAQSNLTGEKRGELHENALTALRNQHDYLENVINAYNRYTETLTSLDQQQGELIKESREFQEFIDQRILWVRSHRPLSTSEIIEDRESAITLFDGSVWRTVGHSLLIDIPQQRALYFGVGVLFVCLLLLHHRIGRHLREMSKLAKARGCVSMMPTIRALFYTILISLIWPGLMWFVAWRLLNSPDPERIVLAAAVSLSQLAGVFAILELVRQSLRPHGLCDAHFGWPLATLRAVRIRLRKLMILGLPLAAIVALVHFHNGDGRFAAVERLFFMATMLVLAWFSHSILHPKTGAFRELRAMRSGGWLDRLDYVWYGIAIGLPLLLTGLAAAGYYYTAQELMFRSQVTVFLVLGCFYGQAMLQRWVMLRHRRLKLQQLRERQAALVADRTNSEESGAPLPEVDTSGIDLTSISQQSGRLISTTLILIGLVGLWLIWSDVVPALRFLDRWPIGSTLVQVTEQVLQKDGTFETVYNEEVRTITIANLIMAAFIFTLTVTAARNIPGLLEMTVLQRLPIDRSTAYAVTALVRYSLVLIGIMLASRTVGIGWSKVQWLAAALTFGLGFGLQEIFANFVSGIIILFEQPVRVGDVVTIDGVSGVVNRIRIRATTITDWDRKEYIVPNREFITGRLLNWTLSDTMNRVVINIGVAYGSDTSLVRETILQVAKEHENVLEDPAPLVTFESFGDSSLNFVLRAYLPNLDNRLHTIHDLHATINDRLAEKNIEIPFPQRDLHLRSTIRIDERYSPSSNGHHESLQTESITSNGDGLRDDTR